MYRERSLRAAARFVKELEQAFTAIAETPGSWPHFGGGFHSSLSIVKPGTLSRWSPSLTDAAGPAIGALGPGESR